MHGEGLVSNQLDIERYIRAEGSDNGRRWNVVEHERYKRTSQIRTTKEILVSHARPFA